MTRDVGTVNFTLWRNDTLLGRVRIPFPSTDSTGVCGMLEVEPAFADIAELMQVRSPFEAGRPVTQTLLRDVPHGHQGSSVELREATAEEARGLPRDQILDVRDESGAWMEADFLVIKRLEGPTVSDRSELAGICNTRGIQLSPWMLAARRQPSW
jgi:hypothetical protein